MRNKISQYHHSVVFNPQVPDEATLEMRVFEMGLEREAFSIIRTGSQSASLKFWEPDRYEALRLLDRLEAIAPNGWLSPS